MASIFLSYARDDLETAKRLAGAMEAAGHSVWWDRHISAGARFSKEIEAALRASDLVVVLWSRSSVDSTWVHDEAAFGRDQGRLLPIAIDEIEPPLGFRQFQAMRVARSARKPEEFLAAVANRLGQPVSVPRRRSKWSVDRFPLWRWGAVGAAVTAILVALYISLRDRPAAPSNTVTVVAMQGGDERRSQELARTIAADLGRYRAGPLGSLTILSGDGSKARNAEYRVDIGVSAIGAQLRTDMSLLSPDEKQILWSTTVEGPANQFVDLRQRAAAQLGGVLTCAIDLTSKGDRLSSDVLSLYLNGCARTSDLNMFEPDEEVLSIFRQVTAKAPKFAAGWANLALIQVQALPGTAPPERPALFKDLAANMAKAKQLGPNLPETIAAQAQFYPNDGTKPAHALAVLDQGIIRHPDSALLHFLRSTFLADVGRQNEAVTASLRALQLNPTSPAIRDIYISQLAYSGRVEAAYKALGEADAVWPGSTVLQQARYRLDLRYGDPRAALRELRQRGSGDLRPVPMDTAWLSFLEARIKPSPANVEKALESFRARYRRDPADIPGYLQALGTFGRVDEAYDVVKPALALDSLFVSTEALFRPHMRPIRADPRFIALAAKLGLLAYWEKTTIWPDFCREPQLPYNCRMEAAKLTIEQRRLAKFFPGAGQ